MSRNFAAVQTFATECSGSSPAISVFSLINVTFMIVRRDVFFTSNTLDAGGRFAA